MIAATTQDGVSVYEYRTSGTCSRSVKIRLEGDTIVSIKFEGGCEGNLRGIASLVAGMKVEEAIRRLSSIPCGDKSTSCPDQLARALREIVDLSR